MDHPSSYVWPGINWWKQKEDIASRMTIAQLHYARLDCHKAAEIDRQSENNSKYHDEGSIYAMEMARR